MSAAASTRDAKLEVLALESYFTGSHRAFLEQWSSRSRHRLELLTLPGRHWKWRMRHAAVSFAGQLRQDASKRRFAAVFATDMVSLAEFRGLAPVAVAGLPTVLYFHESQLNYPDRRAHDGDLHFAMTNLTSAIAADAVWFNSSFHRDAFFTATEAWLRRMPEHRLLEELDALRAKCSVQHPGVEMAPRRSRASAESAPAAPLHILWAARWEHDKNPEQFFEVLRRLRQRVHGSFARDTPPFVVSVVGESFREVPQCFEQARRELADVIVNWGYVPSRQEYLRIVAEADVFVSTARHEFFGLSAAEALLAGTPVLLPDRLAYPELVQSDASCLYASEGELLERLGEMVAAPRERRNDIAEIARRRFSWSVRAADLDGALERLVQQTNP